MSYRVAILQNFPVPRSARELAIEVVKLDGEGEMTEAQSQRVTNVVDAGLRAKLGKLVEYDDGLPRRWRIEMKD